MADKKEIRAKAAIVDKALKELLESFEDCDSKVRLEMNGLAKELAGKVGDYKKKLTVASRFKVLKKRGRPSGANRALKKLTPKKPAAKKPAAKKPVAAKVPRPAAKKPVAAKAVVAISEQHPDLGLRSQS